MDLIPEKPSNPIATFNRVWRITERIVRTVAALLVIGTVGFVSLHALV